MRRASLPILGLMLIVVFFWSTPFLWTLVASFRPDGGGGIGMASLVPDYAPTWDNFTTALQSGNFGVYYLNTAIIAFGILAVQIVTISLAGYAFARLSFPCREFIFYIFLLQLMLVPPILIVPNLR
ncbi:MAG: carbohydrate ABC transporter permease, partial [Alphaproteobacteria bacterium]|nr:carbohydrate ABC transporter permease [Alphaproteobacteria bacterium]